MRLPQPCECTVGALGTWSFPSGVYLYIGSAWGPGGLRARVGRHLRGSLHQRWHIDYLRAHAQPVAVWLAQDAQLECAWAQHLEAHACAQIVVPRFGASDCQCNTHLFHLVEVNVEELNLADDLELCLVAVDKDTLS